MKTQIACPSCQKEYEITEESLGQPATCDRCGEVFTMGGKKTPAPAPPMRSAEPLRVVVTDFDISAASIFWITLKAIPALAAVGLLLYGIARLLLSLG